MKIQLKTEEEKKKIAYEIMEKFNDYSLSIGDAQEILDCLSKHIFPEQIQRSKRDVGLIPFVVKPAD